MDDGSSDESDGGANASKIEDAAHGRRVLTPRVAAAVKEALAAEDASCEARVDLKDPDIVVFVEVFCARAGDGGDERAYVVVENTKDTLLRAVRDASGFSEDAFGSAKGGGLFSRGGGAKFFADGDE